MVLRYAVTLQVCTHPNNTLDTPVSTLTNIFQSNQGHVIGRGFFAPQFGTVSPLNDGKRCPTGMSADLVDFQRKIKLLTTGYKTRTNHSHVSTQTVSLQCQHDVGRFRISNQSLRTQSICNQPARKFVPWEMWEKCCCYWHKRVIGINFTCWTLLETMTLCCCYVAPFMMLKIWNPLKNKTRDVRIT